MAWQMARDAVRRASALEPVTASCQHARAARRAATSSDPRPESRGVHGPRARARLQTMCVASLRAQHTPRWVARAGQGWRAARRASRGRPRDFGSLVRRRRTEACRAGASSWQSRESFEVMRWRAKSAKLGGVAHVARPLSNQRAGVTYASLSRCGGRCGRRLEFWWWRQEFWRCRNSKLVKTHRRQSVLHPRRQTAPQPPSGARDVVVGPPQRHPRVLRGGWQNFKTLKTRVFSDPPQNSRT